MSLSLAPIASLENPVVWSDLNTIVATFPGWHYFRNQSVLITGGNGLLASYLVRALLLSSQLLDLDLSVTCLIRSHQSDISRLQPWIKSSNLNIVYGSVEGYPFELLDRHSNIIHAASGASPRLYRSNPLSIIHPNTIGTDRLCSQAVDWSCNRLLFFSTGEIYGELDKTDFMESDSGNLDPSQLRSCYAESKRCGETIAAAYFHQHGLSTVSARIFHTYGPQIRLDDGRVFADFLRDSLLGGPIQLASSGEAMRCFCYLSDATLAFLFLIVYGSGGHAYNVANPDAETSILDLASLIAQLSNPSLDVVSTDPNKTKPGYIPSPVKRSLPSIDKIRDLGWSPKQNLKMGFERTILSFL